MQPAFLALLYWDDALGVERPLRIPQASDQNLQFLPAKMEQMEVADIALDKWDRLKFPHFECPDGSARSSHHQREAGSKSLKFSAIKAKKLAACA